ncbi:MAG TPA: hypothetical protein PKH54_13145, partial [Myxococcota bacterium]|nr:hypothetical protein [Myxococcota bacterium]
MVVRQGRFGRLGRSFGVSRHQAEQRTDVLYPKKFRRGCGLSSGVGGYGNESVPCDQLQDVVGVFVQEAAAN